MAAPVGNSIELNTVRELHFFLLRKALEFSIALFLSPGLPAD